MRLKEIELYKNKLKLSDYQKEVLVGLLLGDGHLETQNSGRTYRLKVEHTYWQKDYTDWLYKVFQEWVLTAPQEKQQTVNSVVYRKYWFSTVSHGAFRFYAQQFYENRRKVLPKLIKKWLSPLAMAVWFMDDGSLKSNRHRALIFNTQSFSKTEVLRLSTILEEKLGISSVLRKQSRKTEEIYQLITVKDGADKLAEIIRPYILPSMRYKLGILGNKIA